MASDGENKNTSQKDPREGEEKKVYGEDSNQYQEQQSNNVREEGTESEQIGAETTKAATSSAKKIGSTAFSVFKILLKAIKNSFKVNPIFGLIILVIIFLLVLIKTYFPEFSFSDDSVSSTDSQAAQNISAGEIKDSNYEKYSKDLKKILSKYAIDGELEDYYKFKQETNDTQVIGNLVSDTSENIDLYNKNSGYQIVNQEAVLLLLIERLSYAFSELEWKPTYKNNDSESVICSEYNRISKELAKYFNDRVASSMKGDSNPNTFTTGEQIPETVIAYYKENTGIDTNEIRDKISYLHKILIRNRTHNFKISDSSLSCPNLTKWLRAPELHANSDTVTESLDYKNLQDVEEAYKLSYELLHHEVTLNNTLNEKSKNSIFADENMKKRLERAIKILMPMFEYGTYSEKVAKKTFFDYELYDGKSFDQKGNYKLDNAFKLRFYPLATKPGYDIDYSIVEKVRIKEAQLKNLDIILDTLTNERTYEKEIIEEERQKLINEIQYEPDEYEPLNLYGKTKKIEEDYKKRSKDLEKVLLNLGNNTTRPYDAKNHNIYVDNDSYLGRYKYYNKSGNLVNDEKVDSYTEIITVKATGSGSVDGIVTDPSVFESAASISVETSIDVSTVQKSLHPVRFQSIFINMNYEYEKKENITSQNIVDDLKKAYDGASWSSTVVYDEKKNPRTEFTKVAEVAAYNSGSVEVKAIPGTENLDNELIVEDELKEYYGLEEADSENVSGKTKIFGGYGLKEDDENKNEKKKK